jgi:hypothetical protein
LRGVQQPAPSPTALYCSRVLRKFHESTTSSRDAYHRLCHDANGPSGGEEREASLSILILLRAEFRPDVLVASACPPYAIGDDVSGRISGGRDHDRELRPMDGMAYQTEDAVMELQVHVRLRPLRRGQRSSRRRRGHRPSRIARMNARPSMFLSLRPDEYQFDLARVWIAGKFRMEGGTKH